MTQHDPFSSTMEGGAKRSLRTLNDGLTAWLVNDAYPRWAQHGIDPRDGGFFEALGQDGRALTHPRRARVHPRQIYAFAQAPAFGWRGDAAGIADRGIKYFTAHYLRSDGLFRTLADDDGTALDDRALLYDQAFALLGFAAAATALDARGEFERRALALRSAIDTRLGTPGGSFLSERAVHTVRESNPHMHLLEACLAWAAIGNDSGWSAWVRSLVDVAVAHFIRRDSGALGECYTPTWQPSAGVAGRAIEPGHQFEWAWLLLRCELHHPAPLRETALRLLWIGEQYGVRRGVAINQLLDDMTVADPNARFWPQTERLKAALLAAQLTGQPQYWTMAHQAAMSFLPFLNTQLPGLWFDMRRPSGEFIDSPVPASTLYHLVGAIAALNSALHSTA
ncbi:MAG: AGE family epimerase/isomerase [Gammaproteobacteria bacterium]